MNISPEFSMQEVSSAGDWDIKVTYSVPKGAKTYYFKSTDEGYTDLVRKLFGEAYNDHEFIRIGEFILQKRYIIEIRVSDR